MSGDPRAILIVKPSALGDVIQHVVVARALAARFPAAKLGWLVNDGFAALLEPLSFLHHVHRFERSKMRGLGGVLKGRDSLRALGLELREVGYDLTIDLQGLARSAWLARSSGARRRLGSRAAREFAWLLYSDAIRVDQRLHSIDRSFALLEGAGMALDRNTSTDLEVSASEIGGIKSKLSGGTDDLIVLTPGARWPSKMWPAERWIELGKALTTRGQLVISGAPNEAELCAQIANALPAAVDISGKTNLRELAALFSIAKLAVGNDSGPMHLARAQNCPLVALFGPTDPTLTGPWGRLEDVVRPDGLTIEHKMYRRVPDDRIMRQISVESVLEVALRKLDSKES